MKNLILLVFILFCTESILAQILKTSESQSTVLFDNTNIGFDVSDSELSFSTNNYAKSIIEPKGVLFGGNISGKNDDGLTPLLSGGEFQPSSGFNLLVGGYFSNSDKLDDELTTLFKADGQKINGDQRELFKYLTNTLQKELVSVVDSLATTDTEKASLNELLKSHFDEKNRKGIPTLKSTILKMSKSEENPNFKLLLDQMLLVLESDDNLKLYEANIKLIAKRKKKKIEKANALNLNNYRRFTFYATAGMSQQKFNLFNGWNQANPDDSFSKEEFRAGNFGFGLNYRFWKNWAIGARYIREKSNNKSSLTKREFEISVTESFADTTYTEKDKKTAFEADGYLTLMLNRFDFDVVKYISLKNKTIILLDVYLRVKANDKSSKVANVTDFGLATSFYKKGGNFIGGLYFELPDVDNNKDELKKMPENKDWYERLSFGIYVKYSLKSLLDPKQS